MLKQLKRRFISAAMRVFCIVTLMIVSGINLMNYTVTANRQDEVMQGILEYEQMRADSPNKPMPMISEMSWSIGPEADFTTRFFVMKCDLSGNILRVSSDHISSVDDKTMAAYTQAVLSNNNQKGYYQSYRYMVSYKEKGQTVVFLNVANEMRFTKSLLIISMAIAFFSLLIVFILMMIYARKAIEPYVKNIERQKQFITDAGHELKTPLTSIATSADILAMENEEDFWVCNIQKQTARLTHLVSDLVRLSRLDEETPYLEKKSFSLSDAVWEISEPFAALAKASQKSYTQSIEENLIYVGDKNAVQQMLSALLDNAVKYTEPGGKISLKVYAKRHKIYCEVFNTCQLQKTTDLSRLFDRFYRLDESRSVHTGGSGIGLSLAKAIAEAHGGQITVQSQNHQEILFRVILTT